FFEFMCKAYGAKQGRLTQLALGDKSPCTPNTFIGRRVPNVQGGSDMAFALLVNGVQYSVDAEPETPLLWVLRDSIGLTGTKYGCGIGQCGACTVLLDGVAVRSCFMQASRAVGRKITTIEGLSTDGSHPVQLAWKEFDVPQCGYCQSGQILAAVSLLEKQPH